MNFIRLSILLGLMMMSAEASEYCFNAVQCRNVSMLSFKHLSTHLNTLSVAPWSYSNISDESWLSETIHYAVCDSCKVKDMVAKPIFLEISVLRRSSDQTQWCIRPYSLSVGCTCVPK